MYCSYRDTAHERHGFGPYHAHSFFWLLVTAYAPTELIFSSASLSALTDLPSCMFWFNSTRVFACKKRHVYPFPCSYHGWGQLQHHRLTGSWFFFFFTFYGDRHMTCFLFEREAIFVLKPKTIHQSIGIHRNDAILSRDTLLVWITIESVRKDISCSTRKVANAWWQADNSGTERSKRGEPETRVQGWTLPRLAVPAKGRACIMR